MNAVPTESASRGWVREAFRAALGATMLGLGLAIRRERQRHQHGRETTTAELVSPCLRPSHADRLSLFVEHRANKRLRGLGTALYRWTKGGIAPRNRDVLLLTTRGRRSGREHTVLLQGFRDGTGMVLAAANSGRPTDPDWFRNLTATPTAWVELEDRSLPVRAERLSAEEAAACWPRILRHAPSYARYRKAADRDIPLVRLVPIGSDEKGFWSARPSTEGAN